MSTNKRKKRSAEASQIEPNKKRRKRTPAPEKEPAPPAPDPIAIIEAFPDVIVEEVPFVNKDMDWAYSANPNVDGFQSEVPDVIEDIATSQSTLHTIDQHTKVSLDGVPTTAPIVLPERSSFFDHVLTTSNIISEDYTIITSRYKSNVPNKMLFDYLIDVISCFLCERGEHKFYFFVEGGNGAEELTLSGRTLNLGAKYTQTNFDLLVPCIAINPTTHFEDVLEYFSKMITLLTPGIKDSDTTLNLVMAATVHDPSQFVRMSMNTKSHDRPNLRNMTTCLENAFWVHGNIYDFPNLRWAMDRTILGPSTIFPKVGISVSNAQQKQPLNLLWALLLMSILFRHKFMQYTGGDMQSNNGAYSTQTDMLPEVRCEFLRPFVWAIQSISLSGRKEGQCLDGSDLDHSVIMYTVIHTVWVIRHVHSGAKTSQRLIVDKLYFLLPTYILPNSHDAESQSEVVMDSMPQAHKPFDPMEQGNRLREFMNLMIGFSIKNQILQSHPFESHTRDIDRLGFDPFSRAPDPARRRGVDSITNMASRLRHELLDELSRDARLHTNGLIYTNALSAIACSKGMDYEFVPDCALDINNSFIHPNIHMKSHHFSIWVRAFDFNIMRAEEQPPLISLKDMPDSFTSSSASEIGSFRFCPYFCWWTLPEFNFIMGHNSTDIYKAIKASETIINVEQLGDTPASLSVAFRSHIAKALDKTRELMADPGTAQTANPIYSKFDHPASHVNKEYNASTHAAPTLNACYLSVDLNVVTMYYLKNYDHLSGLTKHPVLSAIFKSDVPLSVAEFYKSVEVQSKDNRAFNDAICRKCVLLFIHLAVDLYSRKMMTRIHHFPQDGKRYCGLITDSQRYYSWVLTKRQLVYQPRPFTIIQESPYSTGGLYYKSVTPRMRNVSHTTNKPIWYSFTGPGAKVPITKFNESVVQASKMYTHHGESANPVDNWIHLLKCNKMKSEPTLMCQNAATMSISSDYYKMKHKQLAARWAVDHYARNVGGECQSSRLHVQSLAEMLAALVGAKNSCLISAPIKIFNTPQITPVNAYQIKTYIHSQDDPEGGDVDSTAFGHGHWVDSISVSKDGTSFTEYIFHTLINSTKDGDYVDGLDLTYTFKSCLDEYISNNKENVVEESEAHSIISTLESVTFRTVPNIPSSVHQLSLFDYTAQTLCDISLESADQPRKNTFRRLFVTTKTQALSLVVNGPECDGCSLSPDPSLTSFLLTYRITKEGIGKYHLVYPVFKQDTYMFVYVPIKSRRTVDFLLTCAICIIKPTSK